MGVHTGEAAIAQDDYIGLDVHRAARICSAGDGGQVLISSSTRELVAGGLPADVALKDLGEHRLKDLDRPEHLFQVLAGDLREDAPAGGVRVLTRASVVAYAALPAARSAPAGAIADGVTAHGAPSL
jgi:class 3 adenylate cyclase